MQSFLHFQQYQRNNIKILYVDFMPLEQYFESHQQFWAALDTDRPELLNPFHSNPLQN